MKSKHIYLLILILICFLNSCTTIHSTKRNQSIKNAIGMNFVYIEAGSFYMGSPEESSENNRIDYGYRPKQIVSINSDFYLQSTEVTQEQWLSVMGTNPSIYNNCGKDCPVENVSWNDVQEFIEELNKKEEDFRYRLPTETEWEFACRAASNTRYCYGDDPNLFEYYAWHKFNSDQKPHPVGRKSPNIFGLYDMHGNVSEWCQDKITYGRRVYYVNRGCSFFMWPRACGSHHWYRNSSYHSDGSLGFRLVLIK